MMEIPEAKKAIVYFKVGGALLFFSSVSMFVLGGVFHFLWLIPMGIVSLLLGLFLFGFYIVQSPEIALVERWGKYHRKVSPGLKWKIPVIETVRKTPRTWEQPVPLFGVREEIDFRDGSAKPVNAEAYCRVIADQAEKVIYELKDWPTWVEDNIDPLIRGYLNSLTVREALDEGLSRGNLLERIENAPPVSLKKLKEIQAKLEQLRKRPKVNKPIIDELLRSEEALRISRQNHLKNKRDWKKFQESAKEKGIEILRVVIADFILSPDIIQAREKVLEERREAEAALWRAVREAAMRIEPLLRTRSELIKAGVSVEDAGKMALELEILETLAENKIWTAGLGQAIAAAAPAVAKAIRGEI